MDILAGATRTLAAWVREFVLNQAWLEWLHAWARTADDWQPRPWIPGASLRDAPE